MSKKCKPSRAKSTAVLSTMVLLVICSAINAKYSGGTGEPNDPYRIATPEDLNDIGNHEEDWNKHFTLVNDVNLAQYTGTQFKIIGRYIWINDPNNKPFTGVFDGNNHKVWNFTWSSMERRGIGLFGYASIGSQIRNLRMENIDVNGISCWYVAGLVGYNIFGIIDNCYCSGRVSGMYYVAGLVGLNSGTIINCYSSANVIRGWWVGGLVGHNDGYGTIIDCYSSAIILSREYIGGLVGSNDGTIIDCYSSGALSAELGEVGGLVGTNSGWITNCHSSVSILSGESIGGLVGFNDGTIIDCYSDSSISGGSCVGGLVGVNGLYSGGEITNCYSTGSVIGGAWVGGLVGLNGGKITNSYSIGNVSGVTEVGGVVGHNGYKFWELPQPGWIYNSYSTGTISASDGLAGGLVGYNWYGTITNCYSTGSVSGNSYIGGLIGDGGGALNSFWDNETSGQLTSAGGTGKTTAEMQTRSTFTDAGWDFVEIWGIGENQTYPFLRFAPAGDLNVDSKIDLFDLAIFASHWLEGY